MARIKIEDLGGIEDISKEDSKKIKGGGPTDLHYEPYIADQEDPTKDDADFENPIVADDDPTKG